jgi:hypothetical protein
MSPNFSLIEKVDLKKSHFGGLAPLFVVDRRLASLLRWKVEAANEV